jgi:hypothetical protein
MKKPRPCPIGKQGIVLNGENEGGHVHYCTPELRALVRAAVVWGNANWGDVTHDEQLDRAVRRWTAKGKI